METPGYAHCQKLMMGNMVQYGVITENSPCDAAEMMNTSTVSSSLSIKIVCRLALSSRA